MDVANELSLLNFSLKNYSLAGKGEKGFTDVKKPLRSSVRPNVLKTFIADSICIILLRYRRSLLLVFRKNRWSLICNLIPVDDCFNSLISIIFGIEAFWGVLCSEKPQEKRVIGNFQNFVSQILAQILFQFYSKFTELHLDT